MRHLTPLLLVLTTSAFAQPQMSNSGFENWQGLGSGSEEPSEWSSIKTSDGGSLVNNTAPQVCWQAGNAHSGSYCVDLKTAATIIPNLNANGTLTNGRVHATLIDPAAGYVFTDAGNTDWNQAMTSRPDSLVGWFRTAPVGADHGKVEAVLHVNDGKLPPNGTEGNFIARARWDAAPGATVSSWTRFSVPFTYYNANTPQWILMVLTSGDSLNTLVNTEAWYDDIALIYNLNATPSTTTVMVTGGMGASFTVDFNTGGTPLFATNFNVELSDVNGNFTSPTVIGTLNTANTSGTIPCTIPAGTAASSNYKIRVKNASSYYAPVPVGFTITNALVQLSPKVLLEGPYNSGTLLMADNLRVAGTIPASEPYTALGFTGVQVTGTIDAGTLTVTGNDAITDWVLIELRDKNNSANVIARKAALVQRDGDVVDVDGTSSVTFPVASDDYFVAVRHRNHLGAMTNATVALSGTSTPVDFTSTGLVTYGTAARHQVGGKMVLWPGNVRSDNVVKYAGANNDRDPILTAIGGTVPTATVSGYRSEDVNMDNVTKYAGASNDRDIILTVIGGTVPTATKTEQLP
ncbi:MAG: hypothetical protein H6597_00240 [Flavobacteriales bacterium]|nr:hypothetical protein [Flavobacteriales bacterium]MCB9192932.1 hypothetical protein [Flavobacteriales bacterium]